MQTLVEYALANWFVDVQQLCQLLQTGRLATLVGAHRGGQGQEAKSRWVRWGERGAQVVVEALNTIV